MWTWTLVRFVHVTGAAVWLRIQVTLLVLVPALRRQLPPDQVREVVRRAGRSLAIVGGTALLMVAASGIALARHESSAKAHAGVVGLKEAILVAMIVLLGGMRAVGVYVHVMIGLGLVMILIYGHLVASPLKRLRAAVAASDWPGAGAAMTMARRLVGINLVLGLVTITVAVLGRG